MNHGWLIAVSVATALALSADAGQYKTKRGNAELIINTATFGEGILQVEAELQPRNATRIDRVYLYTPSGKKLKPSDKTTLAEQKIRATDGSQQNVELGSERSSGTYRADAYLFELPADEKKKGRWFFFAQGDGKRGEPTGYRVEIPRADIEAALKGEAVPAPER